MTESNRPVCVLWLVTILLLSTLPVAVVPGSVAVAGNQATAHSSCTTITSPGLHVLSGDVTDSSNFPCIRIESSDVVFDGNGYTVDGVDGGGGGHGIRVPDGATVTNVTIRNVTMTNWGTGVYLDEARNSTVRNVTVSNSKNAGFNLYTSQNNTLRNVTVTEGDDIGIYFTSMATDNVVKNSTVTDNDGAAVFMDSWSGDVPTNRFENLTIGNSTTPNTTLSFTGRAVVVDQVSSPPDGPPGRVHASRYLNITGIVESSYLNLTLDYEDGDVPDESTLALSRHDDSGWTDVGGATVDTTANELSVNVTSVPVSSSYPVSNWSVVGAFANDPSEITGCAVLDESGTYTLTSNVTHTSSSHCAEITASDVTFDGNGHTVEWIGSDPRNDAGNAILVTGTNVTVRNVTARQFNTGVTFDGASNGTIVGVNATDHGYAGIYLSGSSGVEVQNNTATNNYYPGIWVESSSSNTFSENTVSGNYAGFWLASGSADNDLTDDDASGNDIAVFAVGGSSNNEITDMDASNSSTYSYYADGSSTNAVTSMNLGDSTAPNTTLSFTGRDVGVVADESPTAATPGLESSGRYFYAKDVSGNAYLDVTMPYDEGGLVLPEASLGLYNGSDGSWIEVAGASVDTAANEVSANLTTPNGTFGALVDNPSAVTGCQVVDAVGEYEIVSNVSNTDASTCIEIIASDVTLDGMGHTIDGGPGGYGVHTNGSISNVTVRNLTVANGDQGIYVGAGTVGTVVRNVTVTNASDVGVNVTGGSSLTVDDSTVTESGSHGILVESGTLSVTDSTVNASGGRGIYVQDGDTVTIEGGAINDSGGNGLRVDVQVDEVRIENSVFDGNGRVADESGARIDGANATLLDNTVRDSGDNGFWVDYGGDHPATFEGNRALNNSNHGFRVGLYSSNATFDGDKAADNGGDGFYVQGEATGTDVDLNGTALTAFEAGGVALSPTQSTPAVPTNASALGTFLNATEVGIATPSSLDITLPYDEPSGPHLVVSLWRYDGTWTELDGSLDDTADTVTVTNVSSFATFAPLSTLPAQFFEPTADVANDTVERGENVTVATSVENLGREPATQTVTLTVDGSVVDSRTVTLAPGSNTDVTLEWSTASAGAGEYAVTVGTDDATAAAAVTIGPDATPPTADGGENRTVEEDTEFTLDASNSSDNVGVASYEWDLYDDGTVDAAGETVTHTYADPDSYAVTLSVTDAAGNVDTDTTWVEVTSGGEDDDSESEFGEEDDFATSSGTEGAGDEDDESLTEVSADPDVEGGVTATASVAGGDTMRIDLGEMVRDEDADTDLSRVEITLSGEAVGGTLTFEAQSLVTPSDNPDVPQVGNGDSDAAGDAIAYFELSASIEGEDASDRIESATVRFTVDEGPLADRGVDRDDLDLYRFDAETSAWKELDLRFVEERGGALVYEGTAPKFSLFAVVAPSTVEPDAMTSTESESSTGGGTPTEPPPVGDETTPTRSTEAESPGFGITVAVVSFLLASILARRRRE